MLGSAPIVDFDGTIAVLDVDWDRLRRKEGVRRLSDLWPRGSWDAVTAAEVEAASSATPIRAVHAELLATTAFAILTSNAADAVEVYLGRFPELRRRVVAIVGREMLGGPKHDPAVFGAGFERARIATSEARGLGQLTYLGDQTFELVLAAKLGARVFRVDGEAIVAHHANAGCLR